MIYYTRRAIGHLQNILLYLEENAPDYAAQTVDALMDVVDSLSYFPQRGTPMPEMLEEGGDVREIYHTPYRITYLVENGDVTILAVSHSKQRRVRLTSRDIH